MKKVIKREGLLKGNNGTQCELYPQVVGHPRGDNYAVIPLLYLQCNLLLEVIRNSVGIVN